MSDSDSVHPSAREGQTGLAGRSWPSKTNPSAIHSGADSPDMADRPQTKRQFWTQRKFELTSSFLDSFPDRAVRPLSVSSDVSVREEAASERHESGFRSLPMSDVLREFLDWYNGYRFAHLRFWSPEGELVRVPMRNSHQPSYGDVYYARLKALESGFLDRAENPHVVMLTLTASNRNSRGGWRCPADHLRDVVDPFGDHVRPALHRALNDKVESWEYAKVLEHHESGYGHLHIGVFVDGEVSESDFHSAIDAHIEHCEPAGPAAHNYHDSDPEERPISVRRVDPDLDQADYTDDGAIGNVSSYLSEYIGSHGAGLFDRELPELMFRATAWATGSQRVTFSPGANEIINSERADSSRIPELESSRWKPGVDETDIEEAATDPDKSVSDLLEGAEEWTLGGVGVVDEDGEDRYEIDRAGVQYVQVDDARDLDPPAQQSPLPPMRNLVAD